SRAQRLVRVGSLLQSEPTHRKAITQSGSPSRRCGSAREWFGTKRSLVQIQSARLPNLPEIEGFRRDAPDRPTCDMQGTVQGIKRPPPCCRRTGAFGQAFRLTAFPEA